MASEFFHKYLRAAALSLPVFALVSAPIASFAQAQEGIAPVTPSSAPQTPSHGIAMYGEPALKDGDSLPYARKDAPKAALPLHKAVLDAVIAKNPDKAEKAIRVLIEGAHHDMEHVLNSRRKLPSLSGPAKLIKAP